MNYNSISNFTTHKRYIVNSTEYILISEKSCTNNNFEEYGIMIINDFEYSFVKSITVNKKWHLYSSQESC